MIKSPDMSISPLEYAKLYYPYFLDGETIKKFLIPIQNSYHEILFPDKSDRSQSLFKNLPEWYSSASNSIKKAYFCHSNITKINQGDLLFFFRTKDRHNIQCMGIVEYVIRSNDLDQTLSLVSKRTVFNLDNLQKILQQTSLIILFRYIDLNYQIDINTLSDNGIKGPIQTIREISHYQYSNLFVNDKNI
jgi:hypothetical protein